MKLYHFTPPANVLFICGEGLQPKASERHAFMTYGIPVVWLTRNPTNVVTAADYEHIMKRGGDSAPDFDPDEFKIGGPSFGGEARLTVDLPSHDKRLVRYLDFVRKRGGGLSLIPLGTTPPSFHPEEWFIYRGQIPPHKIDCELPARLMIECLDHHIATHPDADFVARFKAYREQISQAPPDYLCHFDVAA